MTELLYVRHARTPWNEAGRVQGWAPVGITDAGHERACRLARGLAADRDVDAVVTSDLRRCLETAAPIADALGVDLEGDERLRERDFGAFQGLDSKGIFERHPELDLLERGTAAAAFVPESGESWLSVRERVLNARDDLRERGETVVVVTHGGPIRLVAGNVAGDDIVAALTERSPGNCSVTRLVDGSLAAVGDERYARADQETPDGNGD